MKEPTYQQIVDYLTAYTRSYNGEYHQVSIFDIKNVIDYMDDHAYSPGRIICEFKNLFSQKYPFSEILVGVTEQYKKDKLESYLESVKLFETEFKEWIQQYCNRS